MDDPRDGYLQPGSTLPIIAVHVPKDKDVCIVLMVDPVVLLLLFHMRPTKGTHRGMLLAVAVFIGDLANASSKTVDEGGTRCLTGI
tara:strand:+ start:175 stop:432 length:258 start_codon:yes stop_codon:yes gene_type:complete